MKSSKVKQMSKKILRIRRKFRIRKNIFGLEIKPRLSVFRSAKHIYIQAIDDNKQCTVAHASSLNILQEENIKNSKTKLALEVGKNLGNQLKNKGIQSAVFDRNGYSFSGRIASLVDGIREMGLKV